MLGATLKAMYDYNSELFSSFKWKQGKDLSSYVLTKTILRRWGDALPYLQDADELRYEIGYWSESVADTLGKLYDIYYADYNPLHNYDRKESLTETPNVTTTDTTTHTGSDVTTNAKAGYNSTALQQTEQNIFSPHVQDKNVRLETGSRRQDNHISGNIGVTTSIDMLASEIKYRGGGFSVYNTIADMFADEFLCTVF